MKRTIASKLPPLTPRERQILRLAMQSKKPREIADFLHISKRTVDFHLTNIYHKLGVHTMCQARIVTWHKQILACPTQDLRGKVKPVPAR